MSEATASTPFAESLRRHRIAAGLTQEKLAERAWLSPRGLVYLERSSRQPYRDTVRRLADALDLQDATRTQFLNLVLPTSRLRAAVALQPSREQTAAPIMSLRSPDAFTTNLPIQLTSFVGRERESAEVTRLLYGTPLLTLTGSGGVGKTRLALQVAADQQAHFPEGVWFVDLAPLADPVLVPPAVATALGLHEESGQPVLATLTAALRARRLLLLLDNCEHLLVACAVLVEALLRACPHLVVLATSREAIGVAGEVIWRVPSLALPDPQHLPAPAILGQVEAVKLFVERARAGRPNFILTEQHVHDVVEICRRLDGIPLAIELAAARVQGLSVGQLAARLDQRFRLLTGGSRTALPRRQTLHAMVEWSYDLLSKPEQVLFARLAVFAGNFTLEAVEGICAGGDVPTEQVLDLLLRLVDKSLVVVEEDGAANTRYRLLETQRQYGRERLPAGEATAISSRHLAYYREMAGLTARISRSGDINQVIERLEGEYENLRQALAWALEAGEAQEGLHLGGSLGWYWWYRGYFGEGRRWMGALLALPGAAMRTEARVNALYTQTMLQFGAVWLAGRFRQGADERRAQHKEALAIARELNDERQQPRHLVGLGLAIGLTDYAEGQARLEEGLALATAQGDRWTEHLALAMLAEVAGVQSDRISAQQWCLESLRHSQRDHDQDGYIRALHVLASLTFQDGNAVEACRHLEDCLAILRGLYDRMGIALVLGKLGVVTGTQGDSARARACFAEKRALWEQVGERSGVAFALRDLGWLARRQGATAEARTYYTEALELERALRDAAGIAASLAGLGDVARDMGDHGQAAALYAEGLAQVHGSEARNERAACLEGLAGVAWAAGDAERVARLCGAAAATRLPDLTLTPITLDGCAEIISATRTALGAAAFEAAWAAGRAISLDEISAD